VRLTPAKCRAEQARQLELSKTDPLLNRRNIAAKAAEAWGAEALRAEEQESESPSWLSKEDAEFAREFADEADEKKGKHAD